MPKIQPTLTKPSSGLFGFFMSDEMKALAAELLAIELDLTPSECCGKCGQTKDKGK